MLTNVETCDNTTIPLFDTCGRTVGVMHVICTDLNIGILVCRNVKLPTITFGLSCRRFALDPLVFHCVVSRLSH